MSPETEERSAGLAALRECHRLLVAAEAWKEIGPWYRACDAATNAAITPRARELLEACAAIEPESLATIRRAREEARVAVGLLLDGTGAALVFPTTPGATPGAAKKAKDDEDEDGNGGEVRRVNEDEEAAAMETWREKCSRLVCVCDLVGFPQVTIPMPREGGGAGVGLSFVVGPRRDFSALAIAQQWGAKIAETFPAIVADGELWAVQSEAYWVDAGTPETYLQVQLDLIDGVRGGEWNDVADSAMVASKADVHHSVVMPGAVIEAGASVRDAVVSAGARIAAGATVDRSIVGPGAVVGADAHLRNLSMVGDSAVVDPGAELDGGRIPEETP